MWTAPVPLEQGDPEEQPMKFKGLSVESKPGSAYRRVSSQMPHPVFAPTGDSRWSRRNRPVQGLVLAGDQSGSGDEPARRVDLVEVRVTGREAPPLVQLLEILEEQRDRSHRPRQDAPVPGSGRRSWTDWAPK